VAASAAAATAVTAVFGAGALGLAFAPGPDSHPLTGEPLGAVISGVQVGVGVRCSAVRVPLTLSACLSGVQGAALALPAEQRIVPGMFLAAVNGLDVSRLTPDGVRQALVRERGGVRHALVKERERERECSMLW
jgi:hypothetical protein